MGCGMIKAIIKRPEDKWGIVEWIPNTLEALQELVGGYIETVTIRDVVIVCNEEGAINGLPFNCIVHSRRVSYPIFGTLVALGVNGDEFADVPIEIGEWKDRFLGRK